MEGKFIISLAIILCMGIDGSSALNCSAVIVKEQEGLLNWLGNVTFTVPFSTTPEGWTMALTFDQKFTGVGVWTVWTRSFEEDKYCEFWNRENNAELVAGSSFSFRFRVNYFTDVPQPIPVSLKFFDVELCK